MGHCTKKSVSRRVANEVKELQEKKGLPYEKLLSVEKILAVVKRLRIDFRTRIYTPYVTLWAFLSQVTAKDGTCEDAVLRVLADRASRGKGGASSETTSYCEARKRLPEEFYSDLARETGRELEAEAQEDWLWKGRHVKIVDGSTVTMPDTEANQEEFPQSSGQKPGLGFPLGRIVVLLSLSSAAVLDAAICGCKGKKTGEISLFRQQWSSFHPGDILLADQLYDSYRDIAQLKARGVDSVIGMKSSRNRDFRRGRKLGKCDHIVTWNRPRFNRSRIDREAWESLPESMEMRELSITVKRKGYKTRKITVVTTLLDAEQYPAKEVADLFRERWHCELDLKSIKRQMGMHELTCKSPEMIRKEFWTYMLAYNLIRVRMAQAGVIHGVLPRQLSFTSAKKAIEHFSKLLLTANRKTADEIISEMLRHIAHHKVGDRPGRKEPRAVKIRKNKYPYLTKPRNQARKRLAA